MSHMNADHSYSLQLYIRHFSGVSQPQAKTAKLIDINTQHMVIESKAGKSLISFDPPMKSLSEAREKVVALHHQALAGLGLSETKITRYVLPDALWQVVTYFLVVLCLVTFPFRSRLAPDSGSFMSRIWSIGGLIPSLGRLAYKLSPIVLPLILLIHAAEVTFFARTKLRKHQVRTGSSVWWLWVVDVFIGGVAGIKRFDGLVIEKEKLLKKMAKH